MLGKVIKDDQGVHSVIHEIFTNGTAGVGGEVLVGGGFGRGGVDDTGVFHGPGGFEGGHDPGNVRLLLADGDVDAVERTVVLELALLGHFVLLGLGNDGVHGDGGLAGGTVADDEFALAAADRNHRVNGHDARLHWLGNGLPGNDAGGDFFNRIPGIGLDFTLAIHGFTEGIDDAAEHLLADGDGKEPAGGLDFVAGLHFFAASEQHDADFGFFKIEGQAEEAVAEIEHFVEHDFGEAFDFGHTIADFTDGADIGFLNGRFESGDLCF